MSTKEWKELCYISKYLVQYVPSLKYKSVVTQRVSGARVLTSSECILIIEEREEKKRQETEEIE